MLEFLIPSANNVRKVPDKYKVTLCPDVNDAREQTFFRECFPLENSMQFLPKTTIKDIAEKPAALRSIATRNTKPSRAFLLIKKPAER